MRLRWPWAMVGVELLGTGASNHDAFGPAGTWIAIVIAVAAVLPAVLVTGPAVALTTSGLASAAYFASGFADGPIFLALPTVLFACAQRDSVRRWLPWGAAAMVVTAIGLDIRARFHEVDQGPEGWQLVGSLAVVAAAGALGTLLRTRQSAKRDRTERAATEERLRMAQELHDGVGHGLAVIAMQAGAALHVLDKDPAKARANLEAIRAASKESLDALRSELARMSGEEPARRPAPGLDDLDALLDRVRGGGLVVERTGAVDGVPEAVSRTAYSVVQEALTNVLRHARATRAVVSLERSDGRLLLTVADDGRGGGAVTGHNQGMGISGMRSRVEALGGTLEAGPASSGFRVRASLPVSR